MTFTIATGRLTSGTHPIADELGLDAPLVCADGGVTACGSTKAILGRVAIEERLVAQVLGAFADERLASFVFTPDTIHSCERGTPHHSYVRGWSPSIVTHLDVLGADAWRRDPHGAVMIVGIGRPRTIDALAHWIDEALPALEHLTFGLSWNEQRVIRLVARGVSKGAALTELAAKLGVSRERVAVAGDWHNDLSMFAWAGRSYAMPHAPSEVKRAATDALPAGSYDDGAIAVALERWLAEMR